MPLKCDCYPGCWGVHSKNWPCLLVDDASHRLARTYLINRVHYGSYVTVGTNSEELIQLRLETEDLLNEVFIHLMYLKFGSGDKLEFRKHG